MVAINFDRRNLDYARNHYPCCTYRYGNIQWLDFDDNTFDFVLSTEVFEHLHDPGKALQGCSAWQSLERLLLFPHFLNPLSTGATTSGENTCIAADEPPITRISGINTNLFPFCRPAFKYDPHSVQRLSHGLYSTAFSGKNISYPPTSCAN